MQEGKGTFESTDSGLPKARTPQIPKQQQEVKDSQIHSRAAGREQQARSLVWKAEETGELGERKIPI